MYEVDETCRGSRCRRKNVQEERREERILDRDESCGRGKM